MLEDLGRWAGEMVLCLKERAARFTPKPGDPWPAFRWHDSGDIQSAGHLEAICDIAEGTQGVTLADGTAEDIRYWLPTREYASVSEALRRRRGTFPRNLTVRVSAQLVDGPPPTRLGLPMSTVHTREEVYPEALVCPAYTRAGGCGSCRACWDTGVGHVSYPAH
jgi:hypothetical protein